ncbi:MAG: HAD family phosphatase [Clostridiales bacterium]|jgi:phosphoglycolate phosphatase-like HAD superfamily hydrolase|nr:HAD family phosphatase [Clostridiales bacterium]
MEILNNLITDKKLLIFDLDGTIADTEPLHWAAYNLLLARQGIVLDDAHIGTYIGNPETEIYKKIKVDFPAAMIEPEQFLKERIGVYLSLARETCLKPFPYFSRILEEYADIPKALLTAQESSVVETLIAYWGLENVFPKNRRLTAHDGKLTKKDVLSDINKYIDVGARIQNDGILLFEDSAHVLKIAHECGVLSVGIEHRYNKGTLREFAEVVIDT